MEGWSPPRWGGTRAARGPERRVRNGSRFRLPLPLTDPGPAWTGPRHLGADLRTPRPILRDPDPGRPTPVQACGSPAQKARDPPQAARTLSGSVRTLVRSARNPCRVAAPRSNRRGAPPRRRRSVPTWSDPVRSGRGPFPVAPRSRRTDPDPFRPPGPPPVGPGLRPGRGGGAPGMDGVRSSGVYSIGPRSQGASGVPEVGADPREPVPVAPAGPRRAPGGRSSFPLSGPRVPKAPKPPGPTHIASFGGPRGRKGRSWDSRRGGYWRASRNGPGASSPRDARSRSSRGMWSRRSPSFRCRVRSRGSSGRARATWGWCRRPGTAGPTTSFGACFPA